MKLVVLLLQSMLDCSWVKREVGEEEEEVVVVVQNLLVQVALKEMMKNETFFF